MMKPVTRQDSKLSTYQRLIESTQAIPWELDLSTWRFTFVGPQIEGLLGYPRDAWYEENFWVERMHPDDRTWAPLFCKEASKRQQDHEFEYRMSAADGRVLWIRDYVNVVSDEQGPHTLSGFMFDVTANKQIEEIMHALARSGSIKDTERFLRDCVRNLATVYGAEYAFIGLLKESKEDVRTIAIWAGDGYAKNFEYNLESTPCKDVLDLKKELIPTSAGRLYSEDAMLVEMGIDSYFGAPLVSSENEMLGIVSVMDTKPMELTPFSEPILGMFATRISVELERKLATDSLTELNASLEERIRHRTEELTAANEELQTFSYSVSHDLRSPLRAIDGYSALLLDDYRDRIGGEGCEYLDRIRQAAQRMGSLIDDLLELSKVSAIKRTSSQVSLSGLAEDIVRQLREQEPDRNVVFSNLHSEMVNCDRRLIIILLQNLFGNAWKYTRHQPNAAIEFGTQQPNGELVHYVRDNGVGFDMRYADKLFKTFQRLHTDDEFEGNGIGLATVQRIINFHNGRIWAEADSGKGATFFFTLGASA
jgi:PAS domain S-box-containing protein